MTVVTAPSPRPVGSSPAARLLSPSADLAAHLANLGPLPACGPGLIDTVEQAGLRGRGGAGFPTARKMAAVAGRSGRPVVVANGTEGEPLSAKDKALLVGAPHLVLDGIDAAAAAIGASRRILCVERGNPAVDHALATALTERGDHDLEVVRTPRRYVAGQETALVDWIAGGPGKPTLGRPYLSGVGGRPTLLDNVETLAHLALVARYGPGWYRASATTLVTVAGAVERPGVYEVPIALSLAALLDHVGARDPRATLVGGYFGRWLATADLAAQPAAAGCGVVAVIDDRSCAVAEMARVAAWYAASSAGQCGACTWGLRDLATASGALETGSPDPAAPADIRRWAGMVRGRGACKLPDGAAAFLETGIDVFASEIAEHQAGRCARPDRHLLPTPAQDSWS